MKRVYRRTRRRVRKPVRRYRRKRYTTRRKRVQNQNVVKYTAKNFGYNGLNIRIKDLPAGDGNDFVKYQKFLTLNAFLGGNYQYLRYLQDYQFVKFNYFAVKVNELAYVGFDREYTGGSGGNPIPYSKGITSLEFANHPMYFVWDLEQDISIDSTKPASYVNPGQLVQYAGTKKMKPNGKPVSFVYRVPQPWRQFYSTDHVKTIDTANYIGSFFANLSGVKNLRWPGSLFGTHPNWWSSVFPDNSTDINLSAVVGMNCYVGMTFRGRKQVLNIIPPVPGGAPAKDEVDLDLEMMGCPVDADVEPQTEN